MKLAAIETIKGHVLNMSSSGVLPEAATPIAIGSQVRIQSNELLVGTASPPLRTAILEIQNRT